MTENIKVCVRVRPFNKREKDRNARMVITMNGPSTTITNPDDGKCKTFNFDQSYWSHDGFDEEDSGKLVAASDKYDGQDRVFRDLGTLVLDNAYAGFNTSLFAYGQTGSGKSYSMVGYGVNKGIVPMAFESLFQRINTNTDTSVKYQVFFSMYEIYMEHVTDLLGDAKKSLKVRENPKKGRFFVDGLKRIAVASFDEIDAKMQHGIAQRTVAATQMNATSSRAHTIVTLEFVQNLSESDRRVTRQSEVNLIDLAGSERATSTGTVGTHLKEGAMINLSLSALGNVISALADGKLARYRESVLTKLLQNSLGGNAKTIMIAALSPADINYAETLSTLRYADRAKSIKTTAIVNESATEKLIRSLKEENERMKALLAEKKMDIGSTTGLTEDEIAKLRRDLEADIRAQLSKNEELEAGMDHEAYVKEIEALRAAFEKEKAAAVLADSKRNTMHRIENLNEDPALCGVLFHVIEGVELVGRKSNKNASNPSIALGGLSIEDAHAVLKLQGAEVVLCGPDGGTMGSVRVNGKLVVPDSTTTLHHYDRVLFGTNHLFVYCNPTPSEEEFDALPEAIEWEYAQSEIAKNTGYDMGSKDSQALSQQTREEVLEILPMITVANAISKRLDKRRTFEVAILKGAVAGLDDNESKLVVKMRNLDTNNRWMLCKDDFVARHFAMHRLLQRIAREEEDGSGLGEVDDVAEEDPFYHAPGMIVLGSANCMLASLCYNIEFDDDVNIYDYKGRSEGKLKVIIYPCEADGTLRDVNNVNDDPTALLGHPLSFRFSLQGAILHKTKYAGGIDVQFSHKFCDDGKLFKTTTAKGTNHPTWDFEHVFTIPKVDTAILQWLQEGALRAFVYVWQTDDVAEDATLLAPVSEHANKSTEQLIHDLEASNHRTDATHTRALEQIDLYKKQLHTVQVENKRLYRVMAEKDKQMHDIDQILQRPIGQRLSRIF